MSVAADVPAPKGELVPIKRWERWGMSRGEFWLSLLTAILAVATIVLAVSSIIGNKLAMEAVADAREANHVDQRAWLGVNEAAAENFVVGGKITVSFQYVNSGKTPVTHLRETTGWRFLQKDAPLDPAHELLTKTACNESVVAPEAKPVSRTVIDHVLTAEDVATLESGAYLFYVFGHLDYQDVFGQSHHTEYCYFHEPGRTPGLTSCPIFNNAD